MTPATELDPDTLRALLPAHALGATDGADEAALSKALVGPSADAVGWRRELAGWQALVALLAEVIAPIVPSPLARPRLLRALLATAPAHRQEAPLAPVAGATLSPQRTTSRAAAPLLWRAIAAAGIFTAAGTAIYAWRVEQRTTSLLVHTRSDRDAISARLDLVSAELDAARHTLGEQRAALTVVGAPAVASTVLASLTEAPAVGRTYLDPASGRALFFAHGLPDLPAGRTYQLWWIRGVPVAAGVFKIDQQGNAVLAVDLARVDGADASAAGQNDGATWAVTIEPAGGVPQPTGPMVLRS